MHATSVSVSSATPSPAKEDGRNRRAEETKRKIIAASLAIVAEGRELTTVSVSRWADVSNRSVFKHFHSIEGLHLAVRTKILMELIDDLVSIQVDGETIEVRAFKALAHLQSIFVHKSQTVRQLEWTFRGRPDPYSDSDSTDAEVQFNDKLLSLTGMILGELVRGTLVGADQAGRYAELKLILGTQLSPKVLVPLLTSVSLVGVHHMVVGTINEFVRAASKPA